MSDISSPAECRKPDGPFHDRCPRFRLGMVSLQLRGMRHPVRIPSYHCALADTLLSRLSQSAAAREIVRCMKVTREDGLEYAVYGPDQEPLSPSACDRARCASACEPGFCELLSFFHLDPRLPECAGMQTVV